jgi:hypothetical protein
MVYFTHIELRSQDTGVLAANAFHAQPGSLASIESRDQGLIPAGSICGCGCTTSGRLNQERSCEASSLLGGYCRAVFVRLPISYGRRQGCYTSAISFFRRILYRWFTEPNRGAFIKECPYSRSSSSVSADGGYQPADLAGGCIATAESQCVHVGVFKGQAN